MLKVSWWKLIKIVYALAIIVSVAVAFVQTMVLQDFETFEPIEDSFTE